MIDFGRVPNNSRSSIQSSAAAYRDMNCQLGRFYETPKEDKEKEELKRQVEELTARLDAKENGAAAWMNRWLLWKKSYELAAKYMNGGQQEQVAQMIPTAPIQEKRKCRTCKSGIGQDGFRIAAAHEQRRIYRRIRQATQLWV